MSDKLTKENKDWKEELPSDVYRVTREKGTEPPFTGKYWDFHGTGMYKCACCGEDLFDSNTKFDSGSGWPSFFDPVSKDKVEENADTSLGMVRTEVICRNCGAHLGHVFNDGPRPSGLRYCINSAALEFKEKRS